MKKYQVIYADPPWKYKGNYGKVGESKLSGFGADLRYPTMTDNELLALPVKRLAAEDCALFMWSTNKHLPIAIRLMAAWGFTYRTVAFNWIKTARKSGKPNCRMGYWTLGGSELCLLGTKGVIKPIYHKVRQVHLAPREGHSTKPHLFSKQIERLFGDVPRIELFARRESPGWDVWGNEVKSDIRLGH
jgi:N6-adenosine-specific RNA methylase IME4